MCYWSTCTTTRKNTSQSEVKRQPGSLISIPLAFQVYYALIFRISKGFRAPGLRNLKSRAPDHNKPGSRAPDKLIKAAPGSAMLFCFNLKANRRIEEMPPFLFLKRGFYRFFATLLVFHSYLQLFINHGRWMRLILF